MSASHVAVPATQLAAADVLLLARGTELAGPGGWVFYQSPGPRVYWLFCAKTPGRWGYRVSAQPLRALQLTPAEQVRVVILGQDPYHRPGKLKGWRSECLRAFLCRPRCATSTKSWSVTWACRRPAFPSPGGSLVKWATHGVLLLNTCLTVEQGPARQPCRSRLGAADRQHHCPRRPGAAVRWCHAVGQPRTIQTGVDSPLTGGTWCCVPTTLRRCRPCVRPGLSLAVVILARHARSFNTPHPAARTNPEVPPRTQCELDMRDV